MVLTPDSTSSRSTPDCSSRSRASSQSRHHSMSGRRGGYTRSSLITGIPVIDEARATSACRAVANGWAASTMPLIPSWRHRSAIASASIPPDSTVPLAVSICPAASSVE